MRFDPAGFQGIVPPVITPLTERFEVDYPSLTRVIEHLIGGGVHGLFLLGSTSEVVFHDAATRRQILEHAIRVVAGRVPVLAGVIDPATDRVIAHGKIAAAAGADAAVVTAPFYTRTSQAEIIDHFRYVREGVGLPVVAYDIPVSVHVKLERASIATLAREGTIVGLKDSSGDEATFRFTVTDLHDCREMFCMTGSEIVVDSALAFGADGAVPGLANVDPHGYVRLFDAARRGEWEKARVEQARLCRLFEIVWCGLPRTSAGAAGVGGFKTAMRRLGIVDCNVMARPSRRLNEKEAAKVEAILREVGLIN